MSAKQFLEEIQECLSEWCAITLGLGAQLQLDRESSRDTAAALAAELCFHQRNDLVRASERLHEPSLPHRVRANQVSAIPENSDQWRVQSYSRLDPILVPSELFLALPFFDGREIEEVLSEIEERTGVFVERDLIGRLLDFQVLAPLQSGVDAEDPAHQTKRDHLT